MLIRNMSDLHLEFEVYNNGERWMPEKYNYFDPISLAADKETVLVLAGDIGLINSSYTVERFINDMSKRFKAVVYVLGNHEYYRYSFPYGVNKLKSIFSKLKNVHILNNETVKIDDTNFIGTTLWTSFNNGNPHTMLTAKFNMSDYDIIRTGPEDNQYQRKLTPEDTKVAHDESVKYIISELERLKGEKNVIVSHHAPSFKSVHSMFYGDANNYAYFSDLDYICENHSPKLWLHGHTHTNFDYKIGETRVICNPRGYRPLNLNPDFDPDMLIDI